MNLGKTLLPLLALLIVQTAGATTRTVTTLTDETNPSDNLLSLREAILASTAGDTIDFSVSGTITLTSGELVIDRSLTLTGPAGGVTVSGNRASRIFSITAGTVNISNLTISKGFNVGAGGGLINIATLTLSSCTISGNSAFAGYSASSYGGGIYNRGTLTLINCTLSGNSAEGGRAEPNALLVGFGYGGGIDNLGTLNLMNCTLNGNSAVGGRGSSSIRPGGNGGSGYGGGIRSAGALSLINCTLNGNSAVGGDGNLNGHDGDGGDGHGGGIYIDDDFGIRVPTQTFANCTISGNFARGGQGSRSNGDGAAGGILSSGETTMRNSLVAENGSIGGLSVAPDVYGVVASQGHNLIGKIDDSIGWSASDLTGTAATPIEPVLGLLQDNGGPTLTMMPQPGSAAIDAGDDSITNTLATDQRGLPRRIGTHVDIGAVEVGPPLIVTITADSGTGSLREAVLAARPGDVITFAPGVTGTITLTTGELLIGKNLIISGPTTAGVTVSGNNVSRVFHLTSGTVSISSLTIANGNTSTAGGGIYTEPGNTLILNNCTLSHNVATNNGNGGGIAAYGTVLATNCTFSGNQASTSGGLFNYGATLILRNCTVGSNSAVFYGGVYTDAVAGTTTIVGSTIISGNSASVIADVQGAFTSQGYNLIGKTNGSSGFGFNHDKVGSYAAPLDPLLGPLTDNGGPTFTHALLNGSPARDQGKSLGVATDQRGRLRPYDFAGIANATGGDGSDIGAFELQPNPPLLNIARSANNVVVSWSTNDAGSTLEAKTNLNSSVNWSNVVPSPVIVGGQYTVTNSAASGNKFYRLRSP